MRLLSASPSGKRSGAWRSREEGEERKRALQFPTRGAKRRRSEEVSRNLSTHSASSSSSPAWMLARGSSSPPRFARALPLLLAMNSGSVSKKRSAVAEAKASSPRTPSTPSKRRIAPNPSTPTPTPAPLEQQHPLPLPPRRPPPWTRASLAAAAQSLASLDPRLAALIEEHGVPFEKLLPKTATVTAAAAGKGDAPPASPPSPLPPPPPPPHHFATLARAIVGQQVSGAAAATIFARVLSVCCGGVDALEEAEEKKPRENRNKGKGGCVVVVSQQQQQRRQRHSLLTPEALLAAPLPLLRAAGLSERKASYLIGLAEKFSEGGGAGAKGHLARLDERLDALAASGDAEAVAAELVSVRGVGAWTAHMHLIFHCGSPDVLPVGDLGVKKGFARLFCCEGSGGGGSVGSGGSGGSKSRSASALPTEARMLELAEPFRPHRSLLSYYLWRAAG